METNDIIGREVGQLIVKEYIGKKEYKHFMGNMYLCDCKCGRKVEIERRNLIAKHTKSCGCLRRIKGEKNKGWKGCGKLNGRLWSQIKGHAASRNLPVKITVEEAWEYFVKQNGHCALTGLPIAMPIDSKKNYQHTASLDRIDSSRGYEVGNVQWVHKDINRMKSDLSQERFLEICRLVTERENKCPPCETELLAAL